jgi:DNA-binding response OmpR family regulator
MPKVELLSDPDAPAGRPAPTVDLAGVPGNVGAAATRALVVDDNALIRRLVSQVLADAGFVVDAVSTIDAALHLEPAGYHVLVIDVRLGAERGTDLVETLRRRDPLLPSRCLLMTGGLDDSLPGDVAVLVKPFDLDDLVAAVRSLHLLATRNAPA